MKVFISWSGSLSKELAEILRQWLPAVIQAVRPYYSPDDLTKGARWTSEIAQELEDSRVGLICLTRDNLNAPWVMFEAGALSKNLDKSKVCPILFDLNPTDVQGPLIQFQLAQFNKAEMKKVLAMINNALDEALDAVVIDSVFEMWWPILEEKIDSILHSERQIIHTTLRSDRELLEEILKLSRAAAISNSQSMSETNVSPSAIVQAVTSYSYLVDRCIESESPDDIKNELRLLGGALHNIVAKGAYPYREGLPERESLIKEMTKSRNLLKQHIEDDEKQQLGI